jgi:UDP-N-acetylmuramoyl-L-alanyl-D-glutamate--2,6-diaminopimelate ligase
LHEFKHIGIEHVAIEISSSALQRKRASQLRLNIGVFTSFSQDHLDIHKTMEEYLNTKLQLAELVDGHFLISKQVEECVQNRLHNTYEIYDATIDYTHRNFIGFMESNLQAACRICELSGFSRSEIQATLQNKLSVPGRLEIVSHDPKVIIDYAHTPDGLAKVLDLFKDEKNILVFGCGGDRDKGKREVMGRIAEAGATVVIVTDDNPRSESPEAIRKEIMRGCPNAIEIGDRELAIKSAVEMAKNTGSVCLICGKGHENTQIYSDRTEHFSDRECVGKWCMISG